MVPLIDDAQEDRRLADELVSIPYSGFSAFGRGTDHGRAGVVRGFNPLLGILRFRTARARIPAALAGGVSIPYSGFSAFGRLRHDLPRRAHRRFNPLLGILRFRTWASSVAETAFVQFQSPTRDSPLSDARRAAGASPPSRRFNPLLGILRFRTSLSLWSYRCNAAVSIPYSGFSAFGRRAALDRHLRDTRKELFQSPTRDSPLSDALTHDWSAWSTRVSIPYSGFSAFGPRRRRKPRCKQRLVSIPYSGFSAFGRGLPNQRRRVEKDVSIPYSGFSAFGRAAEQAADDSWDEFQSPTRDSPLSDSDGLKASVAAGYVSIPYSGFSAFGLRRAPARDGPPTRVSIPYSGFSAFGPGINGGLSASLRMFQSPTRDSPLSDLFQPGAQPCEWEVSIPYSGFSAFGRRWPPTCRRGAVRFNPLLGILRFRT